MNYMEQFQMQQIGLAYDEFRPEFAARLFPGGLEEAAGLAKCLAPLLFPNTDWVAEHYQTCFQFYSTYALDRLMGYNDSYAEQDCKNKFIGLSPLTLHCAVEHCQAQLRRAFPTLS